MDSDKQALIRQVFEVERDILWFTIVEKGARGRGVAVESLENLRGAFNQHMENLDYDWWVKRATRKYSTVELADMLEEAIGRADALGIKKIQQDHERDRGMGW